MPDRLFTVNWEDRFREKHQVAMLFLKFIVDVNSGIKLAMFNWRRILSINHIG